MMEMRKIRNFDVLFSKPSAVAIAFSIGLFVAEFFLLSQKYEGEIISRYFTNGNYFSPLLLILLSVFSALLTIFFIGAAFVSPYRWRIIYFILFCLAVAAEYAYQGAFSRFSNLEDAANAFFATDFRIKSNAVSEYFNVWSIIPCVLFAAFLGFIKPFYEKGARLFLAVLVSFVLFFASTAYFTSNLFHTVSLGAFFRTAVNFPMTFYVGTRRQNAYVVALRKPRRTVDFRASRLPSNNIVFIVDESVRGDHLSLNGYSRQTTPFLDDFQKRGFIRNWGVAVSGTTCSLSANNLLLSGVSEIPDLEGKVYEFPTIFQYAKAAGYKTFYFDGQVSYFWNGKTSDREDIDEWLTPDHLKSGKWYEIDAEIAGRVREIVGNSTGNFIWINKFGIHKPYRDSYPTEAAKWQPTALNDDRSMTYRGDLDREKIVNDYDNSLLYNSQSFFPKLFENGTAQKTFYLYTSDHGQSLLENGNLASHGSDAKPEANVPLFIISAPEILPAADTNYRAAHFNIFPTLLDLMNIPEEFRREKYAVSLLKAKAADSAPRIYAACSLHQSSIAKTYVFD